jgi:hypothetical protein
MLAVALLVCLMPITHVAAVVGGDASNTSAAQVRIFGDGAFMASGTLVDRSWVLTARHTAQFPMTYSVRFGVRSSGEDNDSNLRTVDRIVTHPNADLAMLHLAEPVSVYTWIPRLAARPPRDNAEVRQYGWGPDGTVLRRLLVPVTDAIASENAAALRPAYENFNTMFPTGVEPLVLDLLTNEGDSGAGAFDTDGNLVGIHSALAPYQHVNGTGRLRGLAYPATYDQPVWPEAAWIRRVINGEEGTSSSHPSASQTMGRQLAAQPSGGPPMTQPPQNHVCDPDDQACGQPQPIWLPAALAGQGNYRGIAIARCAAAGNNSCSFGETSYSAGDYAKLPLGSTSVPDTPVGREVLVWCTAQTPFPTADSSNRQILRVSFTNNDQDDTPVGFGWWDLTPDQVTDLGTKQFVDPSRTGTC